MFIHHLKLIIEGHNKVEFHMVDKRFWLAFLGGNWRSSFRSTENDLGFKVAIEDRALGWQKMSWVLRLTQLPPAGPGEGDGLG
jgi:hypothetical protein